MRNGMARAHLGNFRRLSEVRLPPGLKRKAMKSVKRLAEERLNDRSTHDA